MEWIEARGMNAREVLKFARTDLVEKLSLVVNNDCRGCVPLEEQRKVAPAVRAGLVSACQFLLRDPEQIRDKTLWRVLFGLPQYWEPPMSRSEPPWPYAQLQAYRWAATILAYSVRNALEDLHAEHIPDRLMPTVNRAVRNSIYESLLDVPSLGWRLSRMPRAFISVLHAEAGQHLPLPNSAG
jgi:hypothetical protein